MKVDLIASTVVNREVLSRIIQNEWGCQYNPTGRDADDIVEFAGRLCYMSYDNPRPGGNSAYLQRIKEAGHGSVLEHASYTFLIQGISRACSHELVRHRHLSFSQLSQRYCGSLGEFSDHLYNVLNKHLCDQDLYDFSSMIRYVYDALSKAVADEVMLDEKEGHDRVLAKKRVNEIARLVLPEGWSTKIVVSGNARAWRHFLDLRGTLESDVEIRNLAIKIWKILHLHSPGIFGDYVPEFDGDRLVAIRSPYRRV